MILSIPRTISRKESVRRLIQMPGWEKSGISNKGIKIFICKAITKRKNELIEIWN